MAQTPKRRSDLSQADVSSSQSDASLVKKLVRPSIKPSGETARAADSVPMAGGPFTALPIQFGRYQIQRELGRGQMGAVYLAFDTELDRPVALKVARTSASGSANLLKRMVIEAKSAAKVDHPLICKVYQTGEIEGIRFIALQYVEGEDLKKYLKREGRKRDPAEAVRIILQILQALAAAHENGVIHRDLKPANVMLNKKNDPVIMDFGLARRTIASSDAGLTQGMIVGTAAYMSPEQATGRAEGIDHRSDVYAVGVMLFEMLTGEWPFTGGAIEVMGKKCAIEPPSPLALNPALNPQLAAVCHKMIAKQKGDRYITCAEAVAALEMIDLKATVQFTPSIQIAEPAPPIHLVEVSPNFDFLKESPTVSAMRKSALAIGKKKSVGGKKSPAQTSPSRVFGPPMTWWNAQMPLLRWTILGGAGFVLIALSVILLMPTKDGVLKIEIDDPALSVKFAGSTITVENNNQPIKIGTTANHALEVLYDKGTSVESLSKELILKKGDARLVKISLVDGKVAFNGQVIAPNSSQQSNSPRSEQSAIFFGEKPGERRELMAGMKFRWCPPGSFMMGSPMDETPRDPDEALAPVTLTSGFWMGETEVTQEQWTSVMNTSPWQGRENVQEGADYPATYISHGDTESGQYEPDSASEFCRRLTEEAWNSRRFPAVWKFALPTEAQWEYACRAGSKAKYCFGDEEVQLNEYGWWKDNSQSEPHPHPVGLKQSNAWGLKDMHGNVWEWCQDWYRDTLPGGSDPTVISPGTLRVFRGGSWNIDPPNCTSARCRSAFRGSFLPPIRRCDLGFRVALVQLQSVDVLTTDKDTSTTATVSEALSPADAAAMVDQTIVVQFEVKSGGGIDNRYLNSEVDYKDGKNFAIFIAKDHLARFIEAGLGDPVEYFKGKWIQVAGTVFLVQQMPRIAVESPSQIKVISAPVTEKNPRKLANDQAAIEKLEAVLRTHTWHYHDNLFPPGDLCQFREDGTFHRWNWKYWVVGPMEMRVHYDRTQKESVNGIPFTFNDDLTSFTATWDDPNGKTHVVTGTRQ